VIRAVTILLNPELTAYVDEQVRAGRFAWAEEAVASGLARVMLDPPPGAADEEDLAAIAQSEAQIERGEDLDWSQVSAELRRKYLSK
jgi:Arc/MetJ-type ribon-helix-helix transcriptional regulator